MVETNSKLQTQRRKLEKEISNQRRLYIRAADAQTNYLKKHGISARHTTEFNRLQNSTIREGLKLDRLVDKRNVIDDKLAEIERLKSLRPRR